MPPMQFFLISLSFLNNPDKDWALMEKNAKQKTKCPWSLQKTQEMSEDCMQYREIDTRWTLNMMAIFHYGKCWGPCYISGCVHAAHGRACLKILTMSSMSSLTLRANGYKLEVLLRCKVNIGKLKTVSGYLPFSPFNHVISSHYWHPQPLPEFRAEELQELLRDGRHIFRGSSMFRISNFCPRKQSSLKYHQTRGETACGLCRK